ncbi:MAG: hypothetical protein WA981_11835 [Glaciecola sp.]
MNDVKFVDPRLEAREQMFQQLHLSTFETMGYVQSIQEYVAHNGRDIDPTNTEYQQLLRDYEITKNLAPISDSKLKPLCQQTDEIISQNRAALANKAQLCGAAISALNHWRILSEIPEDLRDNEVVTKTLKEKFQQYLRSWEYISHDLHNPTTSVKQ